MIWFTLVGVWYHEPKRGSRGSDSLQGRMYVSARQISLVDAGILHPAGNFGSRGGIGRGRPVCLRFRHRLAFLGAESCGLIASTLYKCKEDGDFAYRASCDLSKEGRHATPSPSSSETTPCVP
jgi:hypothetical protein